MSSYYSTLHYSGRQETNFIGVTQAMHHNHNHIMQKLCYIQRQTMQVCSSCADVVLTLTVLVTTINTQWEGMGGCRVGEVRAGTTSPMPDHKGFKLQ